MSTFLITGGAGFIGSHFVIKACNQGHKVLVLDKLTYAANLENLKSVAGKYTLIKGDIADAALVQKIFAEEKISYVVNFAAESHVDNSIAAPDSFIQTNIVGTFNLLQQSLNYWRGLDDVSKESFRFLHISTDEVFGSLGLNDAKFTEKTSYCPNSPYSASKAASDHLVKAWFKTYGLPIIITNCSNNFGPHQHHEKFIPTVIYSAISNKIIPIYGSGKNIRDWIYVEDHVDGLFMALSQGKMGQAYCFGGKCEKQNLVLAEEICQILDLLKPRLDGKLYQEQISFVTDRLGHDLRYSIDNSKVEKEFGFSISKSFSNRLEETVNYYLSHAKS